MPIYHVCRSENAHVMSVCHSLFVFVCHCLCLSLCCVCEPSEKMKNFYLRFSNVPSGFVYIIPVQAGGVQSTVETAPNEAIHLCWKQSLINSVYLLLNVDFGFLDGDRLSLEPACRFPTFSNQTST